MLLTFPPLAIPVLVAGLPGRLGAVSSDPSVSPSGADHGADAVSETTVDVLSVLWRTGLGALVGVAIVFAVVVVLRMMGRRRPLYAEITRHCRSALYVVGGVTGALLTAQVALAAISAPAWTALATHAVLIADMVALTWLGVVLLKAIEASVLGAVRASGDQGRANRVTTQAQILRRVVSAGLVICGLVAVIATFPSARTALLSLMASAGLVSVVVGLAAQSTLGNVLAGIQLATTDAIRVDDVVEVNSLRGQIEEITLTYVVVKVWDERRLILPSTHFTQNPFTNWSRRTHQMTGAVTLQCDWRVPVSMMRAELARVVASSSAWDGREARLVVAQTSAQDVTIRITVSAANPDDVWALQCHVRESLIAWLQKEAPYALPRTRVEVESVEVAHDPAPEEVARLAEELVALQQPAHDPAATAALNAVGAVEDGGDPMGSARVRAAVRGRASLRRSRREKARRRRILARGEDAQPAEGVGERDGEKGGARASSARQSLRAQGAGRDLAETTVISTLEQQTVLEAQDDPAARKTDQDARR